MFVDAVPDQGEAQRRPFDTGAQLQPFRRWQGGKLAHPAVSPAIPRPGDGNGHMFHVGQQPFFRDACFHDGPHGLIVDDLDIFFPSAVCWGCSPQRSMLYQPSPGFSQGCKSSKVMVFIFVDILRALVMVLLR